MTGLFQWFLDWTGSVLQLGRWWCINLTCGRRCGLAVWWASGRACGGPLRATRPLPPAGVIVTAVVESLCCGGGGASHTKGRRLRDGPLPNAAVVALRHGGAVVAAAVVTVEVVVRRRANLAAACRSVPPCRRSQDRWVLVLARRRTHLTTAYGRADTHSGVAKAAAVGQQLQRQLQSAAGPNRAAHTAHFTDRHLPHA